MFLHTVSFLYIKIRQTKYWGYFLYTLQNKLVGVIKNTFDYQVSINNFLNSSAAHFDGYLTAAAVHYDYGRGSRASRCSPEGRFGRAVGSEISARSQSALPDESHSPAVLPPSLRMHGILILEKEKS